MAEEMILSALREASDFLCRRSERDTAILEYKGAIRDVVTAADQHISDLFKRHVPSGFAFISEEDCADLNLRNSVLIDPLDGTFNYVTGSPDYCVIASLIENGKIVASGIVAPASSSIIYLNSKTGQIVEELNNRITTPIRGPIYYAYSPETDDQFEIQRAKVLKLIDDEGVGFVRYGSAGIGLLRCVEGYLEGFVGQNIRIWDALPLLEILKVKGFHTQFKRTGFLCNIIIHKNRNLVLKMSKLLGSNLKIYKGGIE